MQDARGLTGADAGSAGSIRARLEESGRSHRGAGKVHGTLHRISSDLANANIAYAIVGDMALNVHGYKRETVDVDVLVRPEGLRDFRDSAGGKATFRLSLVLRRVSSILAPA